MSSDFPERKSIRLQNYDYSQSGLYFVTICVQKRLELFGEIENGNMKLNDVGKMINQFWINIPKEFKNVGLDRFQIMPNHLHGIVIVGAGLVPARYHILTNKTVHIKNINRATTRVAPTNRKPGLGEIIGCFKSLTTNDYIQMVKNKKWERFSIRLWQRNFYEHIIRNEKEYFKIQSYIKTNPENWETDVENHCK